jgi:hypothetical protein
VTPAGNVLDPSGIAIAMGASSEPNPAVASDGELSLVVWADSRTDARDIYGARVTRAGQILDRAGIPISRAANHQDDPSIAFGGQNYLVVWMDGRPGNGGIYGARVTQGGKALDPLGIPISRAVLGYRMSPAVAFDGKNYLVVWVDLHRVGIYGARVSPSGTVLDAGGILISHVQGYAYRPAIAFDGNNYLVAWADARRHNVDIYGARVSPEGDVLDPSGIDIAISDRDRWQPTIAFDGTNYFVAWADGRAGCCSIHGARVTPDGSVLDREGIVIATRGNEQVNPTLAFDGANYLVAWADRRSGIYDVYGARVSQAGLVLDPGGVLISTVAGRCRVPKVVDLRLKTARSRIRRANCSVARLRRTRLARRGRVVAQSPRPGTRRRRGFPVRLVVGRRG